jgi:hypothetical protein
VGRWGYRILVKSGQASGLLGFRIKGVWVHAAWQRRQRARGLWKKGWVMLQEEGWVIKGDKGWVTLREEGWVVLKEEGWVMLKESMIAMAELGMAMVKAA